MTTTLIAQPVVSSSASATKSRLTLQEAREKVLADSWINEIREGRRGMEEWSLALNHDLEIANEFFERFHQDLQRLTGCKYKMPEVTVAASYYTDKETPEDRINAIWYSFQHDFKLAWATVRRLLNTQRFWRNNKAAILYPKITRLDLRQLTAEFGFLDVESRWNCITFADPALKSPYDFTRSIPRHAQRKLRVLEKTHFDYRPKILDGKLIDRKVEGLDIRVRAIKMDPALALDLDSPQDHWVADYWMEPFSNVGYVLKKLWHSDIRSLIRSWAILGAMVAVWNWVSGTSYLPEWLIAIPYVVLTIAGLVLAFNTVDAIKIRRSPIDLSKD